MRYREIITEIELGGEVRSNVLEPFPKFEPKQAEPRQLELFKEFPPLTTNDVTNAGYKPLGKIGKYSFAEQVKNIEGTSYSVGSDERNFLLFDENGTPVGIFTLTLPDSVDGSGYRPARYLEEIMHGKGYRVSTVLIAPEHSRKGLSIQGYYFLLNHVCDFLMADTMQTRGGAAIWKKMLNSRMFSVLVYDERQGIIRKRWSGKDWSQVYNTYFLHPIVTLPSKKDFVLSGEEDINEGLKKLCKYCGSPAKYTTENGDLCCERLATACPANIKEDTEIEEAAWWLTRWVSGSMNDPDWDDSWTTFGIDRAFEVIHKVVGNKHSIGKPLWRYIVVNKKMAETIMDKKILPVYKKSVFQSFTTSKKIAEIEGPQIAFNRVPKSHVQLLVSGIPEPSMVMFGMKDLKSNKHPAIQDALMQIEDWHHQEEIIVKVCSPMKLLSAETFDSKA